MAKRDSFRDFVIQYIKVTALLYAVFSILFFSFIYITERKQEQENLELSVASCANLLESISNNISSINYILFNDKSITQIMNSPFSIEGYEYVKGMRTINRQATSNDVISSIYLFQKRSGVILASKGGKYTLEGFPDKTFLEDLDFLTTSSIIPRVSDGKEVITLVTPWILSSFDVKGYICVNLDAAKLADRFSGLLDERYSLQATTGGYTFFTYNPKDYNLDANRSFINTKNLSQFNVSLSVARERQKFYLQVLSSCLREGVFLLLFVTLISLVFYLLLRSFIKIFRPLIFQLANIYREKERHAVYTLNDLKSDFELLITERQELFDRVDEMKWLAKRKILTDLLHGTISDGDEFRMFCNSFGIISEDGLNNHFSVSCISLFGKEFPLTTEDKVFTEILIKDILMNQNQSDCTVHVVLDNDENIGVLLSYHTSKSPKEIENLIGEKINTIQDSLSGNSNIVFFASTINPVDSVEKIHIAYSQAKDNLVYRNVFLNKNHIFDILDEDESMKILPYADMQLMISATNSDDFDVVHLYIKNLEEKYRQNQTQEELYKFKIKVLAVACIILGQTYLSNSLEIRKKVIDDLKQILCSEDGEGVFADFIRLTNQISRQRIFRMPKGDMGSCYLQQLFSFIEIHYDKELSVSDVANHLNLNPKYLARLFKKETGQTMTEYISKLRIEKAIPLLNQTDLSIVEISNRIGFSDSRSFIRLFKKTFGVTPGEYKKKSRSNPIHEVSIVSDIN